MTVRHGWRAGGTGRSCARRHELELSGTLGEKLRRAVAEHGGGCRRRGTSASEPVKRQVAGLTNGQSDSGEEAYASSGSSVEWITEATTDLVYCTDNADDVCGIPEYVNASDGEPGVT